MQIIARLEGDGLRRMIAGAERLGAKGRTEMQRGLISGGRKVTTKVKRALKVQTSIKKRGVDRRVTDHAEPLRWVITGQGKGVPIVEVDRVTGRTLRKRSASKHPRDARGRFMDWPDPRLEKGGVTATVWGQSRTFWRSYKSARTGRLVQRPPEQGEEQLFGPAIAKEIVKDQSAAAFHAGAQLVQGEVRRRLGRLMPR